jgi:endonuclease/exonuclease/phosphatase family metal-dependent hydrolase
MLRAGAIISAGSEAYAERKSQQSQVKSGAMSRLRVMTFNIANALETEDDGENAWASRAPLNVRTIQRYAPDLIGFQQYDDGNLATYQDMLAEYEYILGPAADSPDLYGYNTIAYLPERLELLDSGGFYLSETPEVWSLSWDATYVTALTWARFRYMEDQMEYLHLNTHLEHIGELARVESVRLILHRLPELRGEHLPVIFTGDFNCNPWAPGYRVHVETTFMDACYHLLRAYGFADAFLDAGGEDSAASFTFHGFEGARYWAANHHMAGRIDWILTLDGVSSVQTKECLIVRDAEPPVYPSDHYPVVADLDLGAQ